MEYRKVRKGHKVGCHLGANVRDPGRQSRACAGESSRKLAAAVTAPGALVAQYRHQDAGVGCVPVAVIRECI
jgi:hypothetical protein